jgi:hypothetical protein
MNNITDELCDIYEDLFKAFPSKMIGKERFDDAIKLSLEKAYCLGLRDAIEEDTP